MITADAMTPWERGRLDVRPAPSEVLFGQMYEDALIELGAFPPGSRVFCIASAGCTAMKLAPHHEVVAVDINPRQIEYARRRFNGAPGVRGRVERVMGLVRVFAPLAGWRNSKVRAFLALEDPVAQGRYWSEHLDTWRFRRALDLLFSVTALRVIYASPFLDLLPGHFGAVMRGRMECCFTRHPNRDNPYARALLVGELPFEAAPPQAKDIQLVQADAAAFLENEPAGSFEAFTLSNILDGADDAYQRRLLAAVKHAGGPHAIAVLRSFREGASESLTNRAAEDRSMLWGTVLVRPASDLRHRFDHASLTGCELGTEDPDELAQFLR